MWTQFLNESRSQHKFRNKNLIVLGGKHSGKRSLVDSLFDISKTTLAKRGPAADGNRMRLRGVTTAIDYAYLNVTDTADPDYRTHSKLEIYMVEEIDHPGVYSQLATPACLRNSVFVVMLDFTAPWNFVGEVERWVKFIYELQRMAQLSIKDLEEMAQEVEDFYKNYQEAQFDENGRLKTTFNFDRQPDEELPLPAGVLAQNIRIPLVICVNKCDLQSQVLREESNTKILVILYHLRSLALKYGAALVYTSIRNNCNLNVLYEYLLHRAYRMPLRFKPEIANEEAVFVPLGFDNPTLISDSVVKIDVERGFNDVVVAPISKKQTKEEIVVEEDSKFFEKYINQAQSVTATSENTASERESERPAERKKEEVTGFFLNLLQGNTRRETTKTTQEQSQRLYNAEKELIKHTTQMLEKRNTDQ